MKKVNFRPILWALYVFLMLISCNRPLDEVILTPLSDETLIQEASRFLKGYQSNSRQGSTFNKIDIPIDADWSKAEIVKTGNESRIFAPLVYPQGVDLKAIAKFNRRLVVNIDKNGKATGGNIIQLNTNNLAYDKDELYKNLFKNVIKGFSGEIRFFDFNLVLLKPKNL